MAGATSPYDVVVSDLNMPRLNGEDFATRVRAFHPGLPFVFMSGLGARPGVHDDDDPSLTAFVQKPFATHELLEALDRVLR